MLILLTTAAIVSNMSSPPSRADRSMLLGMVGLLAATVAWWPGRRASFICAPESLLQPYALRYLPAAGALAAIYHHYQEIEQR